MLVAQGINATGFKRATVNFALHLSANFESVKIKQRYQCADFSAVFFVYPSFFIDRKIEVSSIVLQYHFCAR